VDAAADWASVMAVESKGAADAAYSSEEQAPDALL
jgi:hypothetical protein